jgi:hypothetical protein
MVDRGCGQNECVIGDKGLEEEEEGVEKEEQGMGKKLLKQ